MAETTNSGEHGTPAPTADAPAEPATPRRTPGHRSVDMRDAMAEMAERAQLISQEAGTKVASAMKDVISAAAGIAGFAVESARDLVQYMVRRGQMTPEEGDKLLREVDAAHRRRPAHEKERPTATRAASDRAARARADAEARAAATPKYVFVPRSAPKQPRSATTADAAETSSAGKKPGGKTAKTTVRKAAGKTAKTTGKKAAGKRAKTTGRKAAGKTATSIGKKAAGASGKSVRQGSKKVARGSGKPARQASKPTRASGKSLRTAPTQKKSASRKAPAKKKR